jgi:predicted NUDIX family phosphoesterase
MQQQAINKVQPFAKKADEKILVVKKNILFSYQVINGLKQINFDHYQKLIRRYKKFMWRSKVENDPTYKQIIPYLIFTHNEKYFIMRRKNNASEARLQNKYSLGIGGHIRKEDLKRTNIIDWAEREFKEEIKYRGKYTIEPIGILNDESNSVGQVHTGFVFLLHGNNAHIEIRDEHKEGMLVSLDECLTFYNQMENWSQIVIDYLKTI